MKTKIQIRKSYMHIYQRTHLGCKFSIFKLYYISTKLWGRVIMISELVTEYIFCPSKKNIFFVKCEISYSDSRITKCTLLMH